MYDFSKPKKNIFIIVKPKQTCFSKPNIILKNSMLKNERHKIYSVAQLKLFTENCIN